MKTAYNSPIKRPKKKRVEALLKFVASVPFQICAFGVFFAWLMFPKPDWLGLVLAHVVVVSLAAQYRLWRR